MNVTVKARDIKPGDKISVGGFPMEVTGSYESSSTDLAATWFVSFKTYGLLYFDPDAEVEVEREDPDAELVAEMAAELVFHGIPAHVVEPTAEVVDLVAALRASVEAAKRRREARESGS